MFSVLILTVFGILFCFAGTMLGGYVGDLLLGKLGELLDKPHDLLLTVVANIVALLFLRVLWRNGRFEPSIEADDPRLSAASLLFFGLPLNRRVLVASGVVAWTCSMALGIALAFELQ